MYEIGKLSIFGYRERQLPNTFYSRQGSEKAAMVFPGLGYSCEMPLLFYTAQLLLQKGYDVLCVDYSYNKRAGAETGEAELERWLRSDVEEAYAALMKHQKYSSVVLVGKSLGTTGAAKLLESGRAGKVSHVIWLTPLLNDTELLRSIEANATNVKSLFVTGSGDPHFNKDNLDSIAKSLDAQVLVFDGADHSLEMEDDYKNSLEALKTMLDHVEKFLSGLQNRL